MDRRSFLQTSATALAAALPTSAGNGGITSSVMLWTLKGEFEEKLEVAAQAGCKSSELVAEHVNWTDADAARMVKLRESLGLKFDTILASPDWVKRPIS